MNKSGCFSHQRLDGKAVCKKWRISHISHTIQRATQKPIPRSSACGHREGKLIGWTWGVKCAGCANITNARWLRLAVIYPCHRYPLLCVRLSTRLPPVLNEPSYVGKLARRLKMRTKCVFCFGCLLCWLVSLTWFWESSWSALTTQRTPVCPEKTAPMKDSSQSPNSPLR